MLVLYFYFRGQYSAAALPFVTNTDLPRGIPPVPASVHAVSPVLHAHFGVPVYWNLAHSDAAIVEARQSKDEFITAGGEWDALARGGLCQSGYCYEAVQDRLCGEKEVSGKLEVEGVSDCARRCRDNEWCDMFATNSRECYLKQRAKKRAGKCERAKRACIPHLRRLPPRGPAFTGLGGE